MVYSLLKYEAKPSRVRHKTRKSHETDQISRRQSHSHRSHGGVTSLGPANEGWCNYRLTHGQKSVECGVPIAAGCSIFSRLSGSIWRMQRGGGSGRARGAGRGCEAPQSSRGRRAIHTRWRTRHDQMCTPRSRISRTPLSPSTYTRFCWLCSLIG